MVDIPDDFGTILTQSDMLKLKITLLDTIEDDPKKAIELLEQDPKFVFILSKVRRELPESAKTEEFQKLFEKKLDGLFDVKEKVKVEGLALTIELLIEKWRQDFQKNSLTSYHELILDTIEEIRSNIDLEDLSIEGKIVAEMVADFQNRVLQIQQYERRKSREVFEVMERLFDKFVEEALAIPSDRKTIPREWAGLLTVANLSPATTIEFRAKFSEILLNRLKEKFEELSEDQKYLIAPWLAQLEYNTKPLEENLKDKKPEDLKWEEASDFV